MEKILQCKKGRTNSDSVVCNNITEADVLQQAAKYAYSVPDVGKLAEEIIEKIWAAIHDESVEISGASQT